MKRACDKRGHRWHTHRYLLGKVSKTVTFAWDAEIKWDFPSLRASTSRCQEIGRVKCHNGRSVLRTLKKVSERIDFN